MGWWKLLVRRNGDGSWLWPRIWLIFSDLLGLYELLLECNLLHHMTWLICLVLLLPLIVLILLSVALHCQLLLLERDDGIGLVVVLVW